MPTRTAEPDGQCRGGIDVALWGRELKRDSEKGAARAGGREAAGAVDVGRGVGYRWDCGSGMSV